jgi:hypothetical protein
MVAIESFSGTKIIPNQPTQKIEVKLSSSTYGKREDFRYVSDLTSRLIKEVESALQNTVSLRIFNLTITPLDAQLLHRKRAGVASQDDLSHLTAGELLVETGIISFEPTAIDDCTFIPVPNSLNTFTFTLVGAENSEADKYNLENLLTKLLAQEARLARTVKVDLV